MASPPPGTPTPPPPRRRRSFLRAFFRALTDPRTFDARANPSIWLGALLATPIPVLLIAARAPFWMDLLSLTAPVAWGLILGAAGRVALVAEEDTRRVEEDARKAAEAAQVQRVRLESQVRTERAQRKDLEAEQRMMTAELKLAQAIQRTLVPTDIVKPDVQVVVRHIPCSFVGGDYLQAFYARPDLLYLCVGDVSGHGVAAALVVNRIHGHVRRLILEQRGPERFLEELNRSALKIFAHSYFFMTFGVFRVDLAARRIEYATAGHPPQLLLRADGTVETLSTPNRLLGMDPDVFDPERPVDSVIYGPGDSLVLFTDGVFEIPGKADGEILGEAGLADRVRTLGGLPPALVAGEILQDLADFSGQSRFEDDVSLMVARFDPVVADTGSPPEVPADVASSA
jgi:sigma-B regulation protein RsbU (phosphoserine phosphatase)